MIQRKQSLFLLGSLLISILMLYLPVFETGGVPPSLPAKSFTISISPLLLILNGAVGIFSFLAIFFYKRRNVQIRICNLTMLLTCILIGLLFFLADTMSTTQEQKLHYTYGSYLPLIQLVLIFLAGRFIKHDEELVRSADRLR